MVQTSSPVSFFSSPVFSTHPHSPSLHIFTQPRTYSHPFILSPSSHLFLFRPVHTSPTSHSRYRLGACKQLKWKPTWDWTPLRVSLCSAVSMFSQSSLTEDIHHPQPPLNIFIHSPVLSSQTSQSSIKACCGIDLASEQWSECTDWSNFEITEHRVIIFTCADKKKKNLKISCTHTE